MSDCNELRIVNYMSPAHPVDLYVLIMEMLESELGCYATLQYESRSPGPISDRPNPFTNNKVDLGKVWIHSFLQISI